MLGHALDGFVYIFIKSLDILGIADGKVHQKYRGGIPAPLGQPDAQQ